MGYGDYRNELPFAEEASKKIGTDHYTLQANEGLLEALKESMAYFDEPHADSSDFPQSLLSKFARSKVKVALSGDGADELFMGYGWYQKHWHLPFHKRWRQQIFSDPFKGYLKNISIFSTEERKKLWQDKTYGSADIFTWASQDSRDSIGKINDFDLTTYLPGQLLSKIDRMGMMHGLEVRSPFLDHKLAKFVYNLPVEFKMNKNENKIILKDILLEIMPREFVYRRKQGFGAPVKEWLKTETMKKFVMNTLGNNASIYKFLKKDVALSMINAFYQKGDDNMYYKIWSLLCLELWLKSHEKYHE